MVTRSESAETWLINLPASPRQSRIGFLVAIALIAGLGVTAPFADVPLPRIDAFIPTVEVAVIITDFITAVLLFSLVRIYHSRAVLALASGYLFTALIVIPHVLTFPGAFAPTGLLGPGLQSTGWLYTFWHLGFPLGMLGFVGAL
jgi:Membrane-associated sensor, integral membrane domain